MKKIFKTIICSGVCAAMAFSFAACGGGSGGSGGSGSKRYDTETRALRLSIGALDQNFNPFFSTSQNDSEIAAHTQVSLITSDENGNVAYGEDWPTAALNYSNTMLTSANAATTNSADAAYTEYSFVIKNGMKFSDGVDLTVRDVLFSFYVLLDSQYTGLSTVYSTKIVGLNAYKYQNPEASDDNPVDPNQGVYEAAATTRITNITDWLEGGGRITAGDDADRTLSYSGTAPSEQVWKDVQTVASLFLEEITSDYTALETGWVDSYKDTYNFTAAWQPYFLQEAIISVQLDATGARVKGADGKYLTDLDAPYATPESDPKGQVYADEIAEASTDEKVQAYIAANPDATEETARNALIKAAAIDMVYRNYVQVANMKTILSAFVTGSNAYDQFVAEARSAALEGSDTKVKNISGITVERLPAGTSFTGYDKKTVTYTEDHDVLKIKILKVDPKAIWNFAVSICPMHYYSDQSHTAAAMAADIYSSDCEDFGVEQGNYNFFNDVLRDPTKNKLPVGAGAYMASDSNGNATTDPYKFYGSDNIVHFCRNPYFETMGKNLSNAKIKYINYKVTSDSMLVSALKTGELDYAKLNATPDNLTEIGQYSSLGSVTFRTGGYGYIGINPDYVEDLEVRQAIMKSFNTASLVNYYGAPGNLWEPIYYPMSMTNEWAYPSDVTSLPDSVKYTTDDQEILDLIIDAGYTTIGSDGVRRNSNGDKLEFTFTIAGETTDHPAYQLFNASATRLNNLGFKISVTTDVSALSKLAQGKLAVWAAAYSSTIDPDLYQLFHKSSNASSVKNWGYTSILKATNPSDNLYSEYQTVLALSDKIDAARSTLSQEDRARLYKDCLDLIMDLAVEYPLYQRSDLCVYNKNIIDANSLFPDASWLMGPIDKIWEVDYV